MKKIQLNSIASSCSLSGQRLDLVLSKLFREYSRSYLKKLIIMNQVLVNESIVNQPDKKILGGEILTIHPFSKDLLVDIPENIFLDIVYEDSDILIINKPAGLVVHPGSGNKSGTILNALLYHYKNSKDLPRAGIVHRLDKDTSGLMVIAKNIFSYNHLLLLLKEKKIIREYEGVVHGKMIAGGTINKPIMRHYNRRTCMMVHHLGKPSVTHYKVLSRFKFHTHIAIRLETGRTHQIRVHMLHIKYPLVGDPCYSGFKIQSNYRKDKKTNKIYKFPRQALHANHLSLHHPIKKNVMSWTVPLPQDIQELLLKI
ncbi:23S rRNA pseudouridine(1911/1915/1917) synthase RluD [Buchnera aphidicola]|uniref:23S rRNA pseudouridine(1911/1915/1917) synthase RluD n=1 Tax=Buchnera aphidicola TaxID=9 RepID=UPI0001ECFDB7|nr:23S rRNA pseudouridine(1911/1915/1917) synthase RluD [Buchnera aphidicola]ADP66220.1 ribosomal large subunit pseudouridine synthase D [Buchnera aphidicola str. LL01 (Acyrthosiphon pisum)]